MPTLTRLRAVDWFKSSYSPADNECVEVAHAFDRVGIRDSKVPALEGFVVSTDAFTGFIDGLRNSVTP
ncbi:MULTISPECIES: DUF397 domain-containing protein [unclassified Streptomyces]|uniref:DUF397 domain-containing protein n=1 Tax=unclassified Streptomyces TaxID=2593676 RepID=UPI0005A7EB1F|nr:DUF397 domain-containing protein [Streptomyces sp. NBRC 110035]